MLPEQVHAGARTVLNVADHFAGLKQIASERLAVGSASQRGYFTPTEDEEVRHLLVSYCQTRNALIELVVQFRDDPSPSPEHRPANFLVAYAGALVLVDAARFLRESFLHRPAIRAKLNEPEPHFGIPADTFETIQRSLTSPVHVWHLYHAREYFAEREQSLRDLARGSGLEPLLELIDGLQHRLQVSPLRYLRSRARVRAAEFALGVRRDLLSRALYGLQKSVSRLISCVSVSPGHRPSLPEHVRGELCALLQPGDVLVTRKEHALTNYFLPGYWPHAALYLGTPEQLQQRGLAEHANLRPRWRRLLDCDGQQPQRVLEALKDGVWLRSVGCPFSSDAIAVLRPQLPDEAVAAALARGVFHEGKPYDFDFDFTRSDRLVCTEVVYRSYEGINGVRFQLTRRAGRLTLSAEDLLSMALARTHFEIIAAYAPARTPRLLQGATAEDLIRSTCLSITPQVQTHAG